MGAKFGKIKPLLYFLKWLTFTLFVGAVCFLAVILVGFSRNGFTSPPSVLPLIDATASALPPETQTSFSPAYLLPTHTSIPTLTLALRESASQFGFTIGSVLGDARLGDPEHLSTSTRELNGAMLLSHK